MVKKAILVFGVFSTVIVAEAMEALHTTDGIYVYELGSPNKLNAQGHFMWTFGGMAYIHFKKIETGDDTIDVYEGELVLVENN